MAFRNRRIGVYLVVLLAAFAIAAAADTPQAALKVGDKAPSFQAKDADGKAWSSADHFGKTPVVLYFYPAAMTGGCTKQACSYRDSLPKLKGVNAEVVAISGDEPEGLQVFRKAHNLNFTLLSDSDGTVAKKFGVPVKEGGTFTTQVDGQDVTLKRGVTEARWTFVIDKEGKIVYVNPQVDPQKDSEAVLAVLSERH